MEPLLDVVLMVHNQARWADLAIRAVEHHTVNRYNLIVVDNGSTNPETKIVTDGARERGHTVIRLPQSKSFSNGMNAGVRAGSAKNIVLLGDDGIVTPGWDGCFLQDLANKSVGLTGCRSNRISGAQGDPSWHPDAEPPFIIFVCVAIRRQVWDVVGPMDEETFDGFSSEDIDYSWRVQKAGYKLKVSDAYVLHAGSQSITPAQGGVVGVSKMNQKYNERLVQKWGREFAIEHSRLQGKGLVATFHAEEFTRVAFMGALMGLRRSDGVGFSYYHMTRAPIHIARQMMADYATDQGFDWLVMVDDDATFPPDVLRKLLGHQRDAVCALAYQRKPPYRPCIFELGPEGLLGAHLEGAERTGLRKVDVSGLHLGCFKTSVFKKLREAGIKNYFGGFEEKVGEDFAFSLNLKKAGIQLHCDTDLIAGHIGSSVIVDEEFKKRFDAGQVQIP
jgi:Glycosyl transferase family 2